MVDLAVTTRGSALGEELGAHARSAPRDHPFPGRFRISSRPAGDPTTLDRWTVDLADGKVRENRLDDHPQEFPRIDERLVGRAYRYGYAMQTASGTGAIAGGSVLKHDLRRGRTTARRLGPHKRVGEFVFVSTTPQAPEDDGVLMGFVYDASTDRSDLVILDAASLETMAVCRLAVAGDFNATNGWIQFDGR